MRNTLIGLAVLFTLAVIWATMRPGEESTPGASPEVSEREVTPREMIEEPIHPVGTAEETSARSDDSSSDNRSSARSTPAAIPGEEAPEEEMWTSRITGHVVDEDRMPIAEALIRAAGRWSSPARASMIARVPCTRLSRMARFFSSDQRPTTDSPARWTIASAPSNALRRSVLA